MTKETAPTRDLLKYFDDLHLQRVGVRAYIKPGKDAKLLASLWKSHGNDLVRDLIADFFESPDAFVRENGYSVGMFISQVPKLIARRARLVSNAARMCHPQPEPEVDWFDECKRIHGNKCNGRMGHYIQMQIDAERAAKESA